MRKSFFLLLAVTFMLTTTSLTANDESKAEVFAGYSFVHASSGTDLPGLSDFNLHGWDASFSGFFHRNLGVTADFVGGYGSPEILSGVSINTKMSTFMAGPVLRFPNPTKLTPFVHGLAGGAHISGEAQGVSASDTASVWAVGGGLDVHFHKLFHLRLVQADFVQTRFFDETQNHAHISTGLVLTF